jgi:antitoxin component YwqK of YwqJK toxin-antitoxin module
MVNLIFNFKKTRYIIVCSFLFSISAFGQKRDSVHMQFFHENGKVKSEGTLINGRPDGYWRNYHINGNIKSEGNRKEETLHGVWKFYTQEGVLFVSITYKDGVKEGPRLTYQDSVLVKREIFVDNQLEGITEHYFSSGDLKLRIPFENNRENGTGYEYDSIGNLITLLTYKNGVLTRKREVNRRDKQGRRYGSWLELYPNMRVKWEGTYTDDLKNGFFKYYTNSGNLIRTERWIMGVLQEEDEETAKIQIKKELDPSTGHVRFVGGYVQGKKEGVHREYDKDGNVIGGGIFSRGQLLAEGITDDLGRRQKHWKFYYQTGELKEEGGYLDGRKHGNWKFYFLDGRVEQEGRYSRGKFAGTWTWYHEDGSLWRSEEYVDGFRDGPFEERDFQGRVIAQGKYVEGFKDGKWYYLVGNTRIEGSYFDGERNGDWEYYYTDVDQVRFKGEYQAGMPIGRHEWYYDNGKLEARGRYKAGMKDGVWEFFNRNGVRYLTITYDNDVEKEYNGSKISFGKKYDSRLEL